MSLKKLIHQCKKQELKAQEELYRRYSARFFALCLNYSSCYEEAQDLLQDGFLKIFVNIGQFSGKGSFEGWMTRIFINTAIKEAKKQNLFLSLAEDYPEDTTVEVEEEDLSFDVLMATVQQLPPAYRHVFNLYVMDGYSHKEIAELLQISEGTSKSNLARARQKLREQLEKHQNSPSAKSL